MTLDELIKRRRSVRRYLARDIPDADMRKLILDLDFPLMFLGKGHFVTPFKKTNRKVVRLAKMYYPVARYRVKHLDVRLPFETNLVRTLGLFGRQD